MKVFLSSTKASLEEHREAVYQALKDQHDVLRMEDFPSTGDPPLSFCLGLVENANVVVMLLGHLYGTRAPDAGVSFTEAEYEHARTHGIPVHGYIRRDFDTAVETSAQPEADKAALRALRQDLESDQVVRRPYFSSPAELAGRVSFDLDFLAKNGVARPTFGRGVGRIRKEDRYARGLDRRSVIRGIPFPVTLVNLATMELDRYPSEEGGRLVRKLLDIEGDLLAREVQASIFNELELLTTQHEDARSQRLRFIKRNSSLIVCFAKSSEDVAKLSDFQDVEDKLVIWHPTGTSLPAGLRPLFSREYTPNDLSACLLRLEAGGHVMGLVTQRALEELAA